MKICVRQGASATLALLYTTVLGCTVLQLPPGAQDGPGGGPTLPPDSNGNGGAASDLELRLSISNPAPVIGEQVNIACNVVAGDAEGLTFSFQPADARLVVNARNGRATWIADQTDVGIAMSLTCRATAPDGTFAVSPAALIIATP